jgi:hypothetical protein
MDIASVRFLGSWRRRLDFVPVTSNAPGPTHPNLVPTVITTDHAR